MAVHTLDVLEARQRSDSSANYRSGLPEAVPVDQFFSSIS